MPLGQSPDPPRQGHVDRRDGRPACVHRAQDTVLDKLNLEVNIKLQLKFILFNLIKQLKERF